MYRWRCGLLAFSRTSGLRHLTSEFWVQHQVRSLGWFLLAILLSSHLLADRVVFVDSGSAWKYLPGLAEASSPDPTAWRQPEFDDGDWATGLAPFGYGSSDPFGTDLSTLNPPMRETYTSLFLRSQFELAHKEQVEAFHTLVSYDDGFILWINGVQVASANEPGVDGEFVPYNETATRSHSARASEEFVVERFEDFLVDGTNTVALQVFNQSLASNDLKIDIELADPVGPDLMAPDLARVIPVPETTTRSLDQIEILFNEEITGLDGSDLLVNGQPARSVTGEAAGPYTFSFERPAKGEVSVAWATDHGITDAAPARNAFGGRGWTYTFDPDAPAPNVVITEFLAANGNGLTDEDGEAEGWIEIFNSSNDPVDMTGWSLSDDVSTPDLWLFPQDTVLAPREFLVVYASGKDRSELRLHTNFKLRNDGEYLGLLNAEIPRRPIWEFAPRFPAQRFDHSYGVSAAGVVGYFDRPTPGEPNGDAQVFPGFVSDPAFSVPRGFYTEGFKLELTSATSEAKVFYTLDGSVPTLETGTLYEVPIDIAALTAERGVIAIRAVAWKEGLLPSKVVTYSYVFPEGVFSQGARPAGFPSRWPETSPDYAVDPSVINSDRDMALEGLLSIPTVSVVTDVDHLFGVRNGIYTHPANSGMAWERPTSVELLYPDGRPGFQVDCGIRTQGGSSVNGWKSKKVSLKLIFRGDYGATKLRFKVFPDSEVDRFDFLILDASLNLVWNHPGHDQRNQAQYVRDQFVADLQNAAGGYAPHGMFVNLYLNGLYWGQYGLHERPDASFAAETFDRERDEYAAIKHQAEPGRVVDGDPRLVPQDFSQMLRLARVAGTNMARYDALAKVLDIEGFADYMLVNFWVGNTDWMHQNWYATRRMVPGGPWRFHSWDAEHVLKSPTENKTIESRGPAVAFQTLRRNPEFKVLFGDLLHRHFFNGGIFYVNPESPLWDAENPHNNRPAALYMKRIDEINATILMESARWGDVNRPRVPYTRDDWLVELDRLLLTYFPRRSEIVFRQLGSLYPRTPAPLFNQHGGEIDPGFVLEMRLADGASGTIYYTTDGHDPRLVGGAVSESARTYEGPIALGDYMIVNARNLDGDKWSALNEATFSVAGSLLDSLLVSEIMYHPTGGSEYEFLELYNPTPQTAVLAGMTFTNGIAFTFASGATLAPGGHLVLVSNHEAFSAHYPGVDVGGVYTGRLANGGEKVTLKDADGNTVVSVDYDDGGFWPIAPDGFGYSLVVADPEGDVDPDDPRSWRASATVGGSPGAADVDVDRGGVVINEVLTSDAGGGDGFIELVNVTDASVDVGGWFLSAHRDTEESLRNFVIPADTSVAGNSFVTFTAQDLGFDIDENGALYLTAVETEGALTGFIAGVSLGSSTPGVSFGRYETATGLDFVPMSESTPGAGNGEPRPAEVVINEIHYHPANGESEFLELLNPRLGRVDLTGWRLAGIGGSQGVDDFIFEKGTVVPSGGFLLLVPSPPAMFLAVHDIPPDVIVAGPYRGGLDNSGERLRLFRPSSSDTAEANVLVDMVRFNDRDPWSFTPDGEGNTLERIRAAGYGNEAENWAASKTAGGTPGSRNSVSPSIEPVEGGGQVPGDLSQDARLTIADPVLLLKHVFLTTPAVLPCEGGGVDGEGNRLLLDSNSDGRIDSSDVVHLLGYLFLRGSSHAVGTDCLKLPGCPDVCDPR